MRTLWPGGRRRARRTTGVTRRIASPTAPVPDRFHTARRIIAGIPVNAATLASGKTVLLYVVVATWWIFVTDHLLFAVGLSNEQIAQLGIYKGVLFVIVTAGLLMWRLKRQQELDYRREEQLELFVEHAPVALAMLDRNFRYLTVSKRWLTDYHLGEQDLRGRGHYEVFPKIPERWRALHRRALAGETLHEEADRYVRADGSERWVRWEVRPWHDAAGQIGGIVMFIEDVTARKLTDRALADSEARLRLALECGHIGTWSWDLVTGKVERDESIARLFGRSGEEFARGGQELFSSCVHPEDRVGVEQKIAAALSVGAQFSAEYRIVRADGVVRWLSDRGSVERDAEGRAVRLIGACVDVTPLKLVERALHDSEDRLREVVETIREVFWISDVAKTRILYVSPGYEAVWGQPCATLYNSGTAWIEAVHPEDRDRVWHAARSQQAGGTYDETYRVVRPDGSVRWVRDRAYPVRDEHCAVVRIVGAAEDITDRKKFEEQFLRAQRLEAIGTLASGVAHDLNNILAPIFMIGPILRPKLADPDDVEMLGIVERSAQRGANVVRQLLTFGRGAGGERGPLQMRHLVKEMTAIMRETFPREIGITQQLSDDLWPVTGDATELHQVLMNLCVNARDAMPEGGRLSITARNAVFGVEHLRAHLGVLPGRFVVLAVNDTGQGIPEEIKPRLFEPFFTTKDIGKGTGLGLSTVMGIVKSHGGFITVESQVGRGTSFLVHLPAAECEAPGASAAAPVASPTGNGELILVVDDEPAVRMVMRAVLERQGYRVLTAADGREALGVYLLQRANVRVVVTDLMMPEMGGVALIRALRDLSPDLAIIAATGLEGLEQRGDLIALGVTELMPKPYAPAELIAVVERELKKSPPVS